MIISYSVKIKNLSVKNMRSVTLFMSLKKQQSKTLRKKNIFFSVLWKYIYLNRACDYLDCALDESTY